MQLVLTESSMKARIIGGLLRKADREGGWRSADIGGFAMDWPKKGLGVDGEDFVPRFVVRNKTSLNKTLAFVAEASVVYLAMDVSPLGEALAYHLKRFITDRQPDKAVKRLSVIELTEPSLLAAIAKNKTVDENLAIARMATQVLDRWVIYRLGEAFTCSLGRAIIPSLRLLLSEYSEYSEYGRVAARLSGGLFSDNQIEFLSDLIETSQCVEVVKHLKTKPPLDIRRKMEDRLVAHPPKPFDTETLIQVGVEELKVKGVEVLAIAHDLYNAGVITRPVGAGLGLNPKFVSEVHGKISKLVRKSFCGQYLCPEHLNTAECVRPTNINRDPSQVPKPARPLYRLIWGRTLAACSVRALVQHETATFTVKGVEFIAEGLKVIETGFDRVAMGMLLRAQEIPKNLSITDVILREGGWPTEAQFVADLTKHLGVASPASVIKAMENRGYVEFVGKNIVATDIAESTLRKVDRFAPELASPAFFRQTEWRLAQVAEGRLPRTAVLAEYDAWVESRVRSANAVNRG